MHGFVVFHENGGARPNTVAAYTANFPARGTVETQRPN